MSLNELREDKRNARRLEIFLILLPSTKNSTERDNST